MLNEKGIHKLRNKQIQLQMLYINECVMDKINEYNLKESDNIDIIP